MEYPAPNFDPPYRVLVLIASTDGWYEATRTDGSKFRNTEVLTFRGEQICRAEVYFGWDL